MDRTTAEEIVRQYLDKFYGFALKRTANTQDAEDLAQEISLNCFRALLNTEPENIPAFLWRIARNALSNYYRGKTKSALGISIDELTEVLPSSDEDVSEAIVRQDSIRRLQSGIAYLSKVQRRVVILHYYEGKGIREISELLNIPSGTVKWHLFEARSDLKKGMERVNSPSELKFNPVRFSIMGLSGSVGTMGGTANFFRSTLSQNIAYSVYREGKTIAEIADCLGVSPVYVESEAEFLEEYGFLVKKGDRYLANLIIDEPNDTVEKVILPLQERMYETASKLISNELFDELMKSNLLESPKLYYPDRDKNFLAWGLLLYMLAWSNDDTGHKIKFEDVYTIRPDGAKNIAYVGISRDGGPTQKHFDSMMKWCGPMWNGNENILLWQINSEWSARDLSFDDYSKTIERDLKLLHRFTLGEKLSVDEYTFMAQKGYIRRKDEDFELAVIWLKDNDIKHQFLNLATEVKAKHSARLKDLKEKFIHAVLANTPEHIQKMQAYGMQHIFHSDGWFLLYTVKELLQNGRLKLPTEAQKISLSTLVMPNE